MCLCTCAFILIVQEPSGNQSSSDIMTIIILITIETLGDLLRTSQLENNSAFRLLTHGVTSGPKCSSVNQTAAAAHLSRLSVNY